MNTQNQRLEAAKLARQLDAPKTLAVLNDETKNSPIDAILKTAVDEVGLDKLISVILESDYPFWALGALRYIPNLGEYEEALRKKADIAYLPPVTDMAEGATSFAAAVPASIPSINKLEMYLSCGVGYTANFSMWYFTPPFSNKWNESTIEEGDRIPVCQSKTIDCSYFSIDSTPLQSGDTVMMALNIAGNKDWVPTNIWFTYNPTAAYTGEVDCHGQTLNPSFSFSVKGN